LNFISIDAVTEKSNISLFINDKCVSEYNDCKNSSHLPAAIKLCMQKNKLNLKELDYIAITIGPGSYTGIRVGLSISQGIAYSLSIPIVPINTMDFLFYSSTLVGDEDRIIGFPSYGNKLIYFSIINGVRSDSKVVDVKLLKDKKIYGAHLDRFDKVINYKEINISSKLIGIYSIENYSELATKEMSKVAPVYLDLYGVQVND